MRRDDVPLSPAPVNDRPHDRYHCGTVCRDGLARPHNCPLGPTRQGECRHDKEPCVPVRTFRSWNRLLKLSAVAIGLVGLLVLVSMDRETILKPGPLSSSHAQILSTQVSADSCQACHVQAASPMGWFLSGHSVDQVTQSDRCMDCHHSRLPRDRAQMAHNFTMTQLQALQNKHDTDGSQLSLTNWVASTAVSQTAVACSTCHREHGGETASLTHMSNSQCQTCHSSRFTSFAVDHPDWGQWPYAGTQAIAFNHASHSLRHFPTKLNEAGQAKSFQCSQCHPASEQGDFVRTTSYEAACAECHDAALKQQSSNRLDLFVLPSLLEPSADLRADWPAAATGYYDGKVGALTRLWLEQRPEWRAAIEALPAGGDIAMVNPDDTAQRQAAETIAIAVRSQMEAIAAEGTVPAIANLGPYQQPMRTMVRDLSPQLLIAAGDRWFGGTTLSDKTSNTPFRPASARTASDDLLGEPDDALEPSAPDTTRSSGRRRRQNDRYDPLQSQPDGGWYVDDIRSRSHTGVTVMPTLS